MEDGWVEWGGSGKCPVAPDTLVEVRFRDDDGSGIHGDVPAHEYAWAWDSFDPGSEIIAYRVVPS